ncbi:hypothetical protein ACQUFY_26955 (plasmid) [Robbsia andropogonis]|uniref:hypothetical protein n=1 Tax=Robbsia andropogonis TaxID=28092 RepID=UPI003D22CAA5
MLGLPQTRGGLLGPPTRGPSRRMRGEAGNQPLCARKRFHRSIAQTVSQQLETAKFPAYPGLNSEACAGARVENNKLERTIRKVHGTEVHLKIRIYVKHSDAIRFTVSSISDRELLAAMIAICHARIMLIKPKHARSTTWIKNVFGNSVHDSPSEKFKLFQTTIYRLFHASFCNNETCA